MTEKVLLEIRTLNKDSGEKYKIRHGNRTFILRARKGKDKINWRQTKTRPVDKSNLRQALENLENLYDELYPFE